MATAESNLQVSLTKDGKRKREHLEADGIQKSTSRAAETCEER